MLEQMRRKTGSVLIWLIFSVIIAAFILTFGVETGEIGCSAPNAFVLKVDDTSIGMSDWRFAMNGLDFRGGSGSESAEDLSRRYRSFDALVERQILANAARDMGLSVSDALLEDQITRGIVYVMGRRLIGVGYDQDGIWSLNLVNRIAASWGLSGIKKLMDQQRTEILAQLMRNLLMQTHSSQDEMETEFLHDNTKVTLSYVKYNVEDYASAMERTPADIERFLDNHNDQIKERYEADKTTYQGVKPQVHIRHILIKKPALPLPKVGEEGPLNKLTAMVKKQAQSLRDKLSAGANFDEVAKKSSQDLLSKDKGGDIGWHPIDAIGFGPEFDAAAKELKDNEISAVVETSAGFHILQIDGRREGDLSFDDVKNEIAEKLATDYYARELARKDAKIVWKQLSAGKTFDEIFKKADKNTSKSSEDSKTGYLLPQHHATRQTSVLANINHTLAWGMAAPQPAAAEKAALTAETLPTLKRSVTIKPEETGPIARTGDVLPQIGRAPLLSSDAFEKLDIGQVGPRVYELDKSFVVAQLKDRNTVSLEEFEKIMVNRAQNEQQCSRAIYLQSATGIDLNTVMQAMTLADNSNLSLNKALQTASFSPSGTEIDSSVRCQPIVKSIYTILNWVRGECERIAKSGKIKVGDSFLGNSQNEKKELEYRPCGGISYSNIAEQVSTLYQ